MISGLQAIIIIYMGLLRFCFYRDDTVRHDGTDHVRHGQVSVTMHAGKRSRQWAC